MGMKAGESCNLHKNSRKKYMLTSKETEVLQLLVGGLSDEEIALSLNIKFSTVRTHVESIFSKLDVHDRKKLIVKALSENPKLPNSADSNESVT